MIGKTISRYRIVEKLGGGGMGVVYRATDTKLNRDVALKVLPEVFARDADRMARFKREAHVLGSLNHPNIASIYGLEEADGIHCLVLELVEGPTLAERIREGAVPLEEALTISKQITEALEAAHAEQRFFEAKGSAHHESQAFPSSCGPHHPFRGGLRRILSITSGQVGVELGPQDAVDSETILPTLLGQDGVQAARSPAIHQSSRGMYAIRDGDWKLVMGLGSGGFSKPAFIEPVEGGPLGQLYNLAEDRGETTNVWSEQPEIVARLTEALNKIIDADHSRPMN